MFGFRSEEGARSLKVVSEIERPTSVRIFIFIIVIYFLSLHSGEKAFVFTRND